MNVTETRTEIREDWTSTAWVGAVLLFGVGDLLTTYAGVGLFGGTETNPLLAPLFAEVGLWTLAPVKAGVLLVAYAGYRYGRPYTSAVPFVALLLGTLAVAWNLSTLFVAWTLGGI